MRFIPCLMAAMLALAPVSARAAGFDPLTITADTPWIVAPDQPEPVRRALDDVKRDWYKVLGRMPVILDTPPAAYRGPIIYIGMAQGPVKELLKQPFPGPESFILRAGADNTGRSALLAAGADMRGSIYAAYALSEEVLGVDPWYHWTDHEPAPRPAVALPADFDKSQGPPTFKYRGWFLNDEDLLSAFAADPLRENIISPEMMDRICETMLRLRCNTIVPGTFTFPDERDNEVCFRRGLALNFHHILVLGLNTWRWPKDVVFSYQRNPQTMERYWQQCVDCFKGKEVIWTVGYRGKHDRPFWADEQGMDTPEARGAAITKAIAKQVEIVRKMQPDAPIISNLWAEGAKLYQQGLIKLPPGVTTVWPDDGAGIIQDEGRVQPGQGIYYHTAMLNRRSNQLSELVPPGRIYNEVGRFARAGATAFFLVNVSDVRPVPLSTDCAMRFAWNVKPCIDRTDQENQDAFYLDWCRRQYGPEIAPDAAHAYAQYFDIPYHRRDTRSGDNAIHYRLQRLAEGGKALLAGTGSVNSKLLAECKQFVADNKPAVAAVSSAAIALEPRIPESRRPFFRGHLLTQSLIHLHSLEMLEKYAAAIDACVKKDKPLAIEQAELALHAADDVAAAMHAAEYGKWAAWYAGEGFVGVERSRDSIRTLLALLRNETPPPSRTPRGYPELYDYQEPFLKNFPLLYPPSSPATRPAPAGEAH